MKEKSFFELSFEDHKDTKDPAPSTGWVGQVVFVLFLAFCCALAI